jgi:hypothetical protein
VTTLQSLLSMMSLKEDLGCAIASRDDQHASPSPQEPNPSACWPFPQRNDVRESDAAEVGRIVSPSPNLHRCRTDTQRLVARGVRPTPTALLQSDPTPRKPHRDSSERACWEEMSSNVGARSDRSRDPQQSSRSRSAHGIPRSYIGSALPVIEIAPGIKLRLRGSQETWEAIARDYYVPGLCWGCSQTIFGIQDAAYVLCPACRTVNPMEGTFESPEISGVGLGFTFEELVLWQQQIADERN